MSALEQGAEIQVLPSAVGNFYRFYNNAILPNVNNIHITNLNGPYVPGIIAATHEGAWDPFVLGCELLKYRGWSQEEMMANMPYRFPMDSAWWEPGLITLTGNILRKMAHLHDRWNTIADRINPGGTKKRHAHTQRLYAMSENAKKAYPRRFTEPLGAHVVKKGETIQESALNVAVGLEEVIFPEGQLNRSRTPYTTDDKKHYAHTGSIRILGVAQVYRDMMRLAYDAGGEALLCETASRIGMNHTHLEHLMQDISVLEEEVALTPVNVSFYPLFQIPDEAVIHGLARLDGAPNVPRPIKKLARPVVKALAKCSPYVKPLELIMHGLVLYDSKPTLSITLGHMIGARELLGEDYAKRLQDVRTAPNLDNILGLYEQAPNGHNPVLTQRIKETTDTMMKQIYGMTTLSMENAVPMMLKRRLREFPGKTAKFSVKEFYEATGDVCREIVNQGIRHLPHIDEGAQELVQGRKTKEAERALRHLLYFGVLKLQGDQLTLFSKRFNEKPWNEAAQRLLTPWHVALKEVENFSELAAYYQ